MLCLGLLAAGAARAEMTEADEAGMRAFAACLDETGNDEDACLEKLGRYAWYPRKDADCEPITVRVRTALSGGSQAEHKYLFFNERCARLEMPHDREAAKNGDTLEPGNVWIACVREEKNPRDCERIVGLQYWQPSNEGACEVHRHTSSVFYELGWLPQWDEPFITERCRRLGQSHFIPPP